MSIQQGIAVGEAIEYIAVLQEAAANENYPLKILGLNAAKPLVFATHYMDSIDFYARAKEGRFPEYAFAGAERFKHETWHPHSPNSTPWPLEDNSYDITWCYNVLGRSEDPAAIVRELTRVSKMGYIYDTHRNYGSSYNVESPEYVGTEDLKWFLEATDIGLEAVERQAVLPLDIVPAYTGDYHIEMWWQGDIDIFTIRLNDELAWYGNMYEYAEYTKRLKHAPR